MAKNIDEMVAVASGSRNQVGLWAKVLRAAAIGFLLVTPMSAPEGDGTDTNNTELWVASEDADEARSAIRSADGPHDKRIW
jgi:hypothetical protein